MADDTLTAQFKEVIGLTIDLDGFKKSLREAAAEWEKFQSKVGGEGAGALLVNTAKEFEGFKALLKNVADLTIQLQSEVTQAILSKKAEEVEATEKALAAQLSAKAKAAEKEVKIDKAVLDAKKYLESEANKEKLPRTVRDISTEQQAQIDKAIAAKQDVLNQDIKQAEGSFRVEQAIHKERVALYTELFKQIERKEALEKKAADRKAAADEAELVRQIKILDKQKQSALDISDEQNGVESRGLEDRRKQELLYADLLKKTNENLEKTETSLADKRRQRLSEELSQAEATFRAGQREEQEKEKLLTLEERLAAASRRRQSAETNNQLSGLPAPERLRAISAAYEEVGRDIAKVRAELQALSGQNGIEALTKRAKLEGALTGLINEQTSYAKQHLTVQRSITDEHKKQGGFLDQIISGGAGGGLRGAVVHLTRFYLLWNGMNALVQTFGALVGAPFKAIADGVQYMRDTERSADDLVGLLASTVKFSADYAENFKKAKEASIEVTQSLQKVAAVTGKPVDQVEKIFKAFQGAGALKFVSSLGEVVQLTEMFTVLLGSTEKGALDIASSVAKINELLNGTVKNTEPFIKQLGIGSKEWKSILKDSESSRNLIGLLSERYKPFRDQILAAGKGQQVLLNTLSITVKQLEAAAVKELFEDINKTLNATVTLIETNGPQLASTLKLIVDQIRAWAETLKFVSEYTPLLETLSFVFKSILFTNVLLSESLQNTTKSLAGFFAVVKAGVTGDVAQLQKVMKDFAESSEKSGDKIKESFEVLFLGKVTAKLPGSTLNQTVQGTGNNTSNETNFGQINADLDLQKARLQKTIGDIERKYAELNDKIREKLAERTISFKDAAAQVAELNQREIEELSVANGKMIDLIRRAAAAAAAEGGNDPKKAGEQSTRLLAQVERQQEAFADKIRAINKRTQDAKIQAVKEDIALGKLSAEQGRQAIEAAADNSLKALRQQLNQRLLYESDVMAQEESLEQIRFNNQKARLQEQQDLYAEGTEDRKRIGGQLAKLEADYDAASSLRSKQRVYQLTLERIERQKINDSLELQRLDMESQILDNEKQSQPGLVLDDKIDAGIKQRQLLVDAQIRNQKQLIDEAFEAGRTADEIARLTSELARLEGQEASLTGQRLSSALGGTGSPIIRAIRARQIQDQARAVRESRGDSSTSGRVSSGAEVGRGAAEFLVGGGFISAWTNATSTVQRFGLVAAGVAGGLAALGNVLGAFKAGKESGGVLGGIGAVAGQFGNLPVIGPYLQAAAGILSFVGQLFTNAAKKISEDVKKSFQRTLDNYQAGNSTLVSTITELEGLRTDAILRLSGKKGGKTELDKLLPDLEKEIASLKRQQKEIVTGFEDQLAALYLQSDTLSQIKKQWADINKQVRDYIGAGGDAGKAAEFLSLSLEKIKNQAIDELQSAEQEAIQSALKLNDLLKQRNDLVADFKKKEFDLINASALERRLPGSVSRGKELEQLRREHQQQLDDLDAEVTMTQRRVDKEREVFELTTDITELKRRDEELTLIALDKQIQKWKDLKQIAGSIFNNPGGFTLGSGIFNISVNVTSPISNGAELGQQIGDGISSELSRRMRMVPA